MPLPGKSIRSDLQITTVENDTYQSIQRVYVWPDTAIQVQMQGTGIIRNGIITYRHGDEISRTEPAIASLWDTYAHYTTGKSYFTISGQQLVLHIEAKTEKDVVVKQFSYCRELVDFPANLRLWLMKRYGTPQIMDEPPPFDTAMKSPVAINTQTAASLPMNDSLPDELQSRSNLLVKTLTITSPDIQVVVLDDAEIDGDIISLYHNNQQVLSHKTLGKEVVKYAFTADKLHPHHEFVLVAENLGSIPPNTALVRIRAGGVKYEFTVHSNMQENVKMIIDYTGD